MLGMIRFRTKRERRKRKLAQLTPEQWRADHSTLVDAGMGHDVRTTEEKNRFIARTDNEAGRMDAIEDALKSAEKDGKFANPLDRYLGLPTDAEEREYHASWTVGRNKAYVYFTFIAVIISIIALWVALARK